MLGTAAAFFAWKFVAGIYSAFEAFEEGFALGGCGDERFYFSGCAGGKTMQALAVSRRLRKSCPAQLSSSFRTRSSSSTGTRCSGLIGGRVSAVGELSISPSSPTQRKSCCSDR